MDAPAPHHRTSTLFKWSCPLVRGLPGAGGRRPWVQAIGLGLLLSVIGETPVAAAPPRVLALPYQRLQAELPKDIGEQTTLIVTREVGHGGIDILRPAPDDRPKRRRRSGADAPQGNPRAQARAERQLSLARTSLDDGDFAGARAGLERAVEGLEKNGDAIVDLRILADVYLQLAIARFRDGQDDEANDALKRSIHLSPDRKLDPASYPPIFIKVYDRARFEVLGQPRGNIEVRAVPGARILLDGRAMGISPLLLKGALPGVHWLRVELPGESVQGKEITVVSEETTVVVFEGAPGKAAAGSADAVLSALADNRLEAEHLDALQVAGRKSRASFVLVGAVFATDTAYEIRSGLFDVEAKTMGRLAPVAFDLDLLSAEIEVFKLADDAQKQIKAGALRAPVKTPRWVPAPDFKPLPGQASGAQIATAQAAPPPLRNQASLYAKAIAKPSTDAGASSASALADPLVDEVGTPKERSEKSGESLWWVWVVVGVAAAGAAGVAAGVALSDQGSDRGTVEIRW